MALRNRINVSGIGIPRMERVDIWAGGYHAPLTSAFAGEIDITDENTPVYNFDGMIATRVLNAGTLTLTEYEHPTVTSDLVSVLQNIDPRSTGIRAYRAIGTFTIDVVRNTKHPTGSHYVAAEVFVGWHCVLRPKQGAPKEGGTRVLDGRCDLPIEFRVNDPDTEGIAAAFDVATMASGAGVASGTLGSNTALFPIPDCPNAPELSGKYAVAVEAQNRDGSNRIKKSFHLTVTDSMVDASGNVTITDSDINGSSFTALGQITHAWVLFLVYSSGTALNTPKLLADGIDVRGRYDVVP